MKKQLRLMARSVIFLCLLLAAVMTVNRIVSPQYGYQNTNPLTETYNGFYEMNPGSVDVLFFGSSHMGSGFNPQELYNEYGIRGYNLGNNSQPMWISYYWLLEALNYQNPQAVVLDTYCLYIDQRTNESAARVPLDHMRLGPVKRDAVAAVCERDDSQSALSYYFPNIRFHTRWTGLNEYDFLWDEDPVPKNKGFWLYRNKCGDETYAPFREDEAAGMEEFLPDPLNYLDKITELCKEKGIDLILVKTPTHAQTPKRHNAVAAYAKEHNLLFYDFNEISLHRFIGFSYAEDMNDSSASGNKNAHANPAGARKLTSFIGQVLAKQCGISPTQDPQYEETRAFNEGIWKDFELHNESKLEQYLPRLDDPRYMVWITSRGESFEGLSAGQKEALSALGLKTDWKDVQGKNYIAVLDGGAVLFEQSSKTELDTSGSFRKGQVVYQLSSTKDRCSIKLNNSEKSKNKQGINIVVYNKELRSVVDTVCFNTHTEEAKAAR